MKRTDIHRPSAIVPEDYAFVALGHVKIEHLGDCYVVQAERKALEAHMARTGGTWSRHEHGGSCHVCGAAVCYDFIFHHVQTNTYIRVGSDCAAKLEMGDPDRFKAFKSAIEAAERGRKGKLKAQGVLEQAGLAEVWALYVRELDPQATDESLGRPVNQHRPREEGTIVDMVGNLVKYGSISDKQIGFLRSLMDRIARRAEINAQREAERAKADPVPTGRVKDVEVEVLSVKDHENEFGSRRVMTVRSVRHGWVAWGPCPAWPENIVRGDRLHMNMTLQPSDRDPKFGFFKRPCAGRMVGCALPPADKTPEQIIAQQEKEEAEAKAEAARQATRTALGPVAAVEYTIPVLALFDEVPESAVEQMDVSAAVDELRRQITIAIEITTHAPMVTVRLDFHPGAPARLMVTRLDGTQADQTASDLYLTLQLITVDWRAACLIRYPAPAQEAGPVAA